MGVESGVRRHVASLKPLLITLSEIFSKGVRTGLISLGIQNMVLDEVVAQEIMRLAKESGIKVSKPEDLVVRDVCLARFLGQIIISVLVLIRENIMLLVVFASADIFSWDPRVLYAQLNTDETPLTSDLRLD